jgi:exopolysaccharide production negative regulator
MRTADVLLRAVVIGAGLLTAPAMAFDGSKTDDSLAAPVSAPVAPLAKAAPSDDAPRPPANIPNVVPLARPANAMEAFRSGAQWLKLGEKRKAVVSLEYAAENGHAGAQWKLGRMYAEGDGVTHDDLKAFDYFRRIAASHAEDNPDTPQARFVASAFVALGHYYLEGIPQTAVKRDPDRAREMFGYAASYFRDPEAQYYLARLYLDGVGAPHDPRQAARWFGLSAQKGQCQAQAMLGAMLFAGDHVPRQAARGLMWLALAKENVKDATAGDQAWINRLYDSAFQQATGDEKALAAMYLKRWLQTRRE